MYAKRDKVGRIGFSVLRVEFTEIEPKVALVTVTGNVRIGPESEQIEATMKDLVGRGYKAVLFDITGVGSLDSTGVGRFISSLTMAMQAGAQMKIAGENPRVREVFRVTRLDTIFQFYEDLEGAKGSLSWEAGRSGGG